MANPARWLLLEAYGGGSHQRLIDGLLERICPDATAWSLPARKWKWRMRGAAAHFAERMAREAPPIDAIFCTSMLDVATLRGLLPAAYRSARIVLYMHENQLAYPVQHADARDHHFAWTQMNSLLAADAVAWNSEFNRDSFLEELSQLIGRMPDFRPGWAPGRIADKSRILPVPIDAEMIRTDIGEGIPRRGPCRIAWNHRWEYDKGPDRLVAALEELASEATLEFEFLLLGQKFETVPPEFQKLQKLLGSRLVESGFLPDRGEYHRALASCDVVLSTARQEFLGLSILEGALAGAVPLVPDALAYPEIWPAEWRYAEGGLAAALRDRIQRRDRWRAVNPSPPAEAFGWDRQIPIWQEFLA